MKLLQRGSSAPLSLILFQVAVATPRTYAFALGNTASFLCVKRSKSSPCTNALVRLSTSSSQSEIVQQQTGNVTVLDTDFVNYLVVSKPPAIVCHHSDWTGSRAAMEIPMLQRVRTDVGRRVNLIHRLDRGCSGCLLMSYADQPEATSALVEAMASRETRKTYVALVRGEGVLHGRDFKKEGWFLIDRPIRNENGQIKDARTWFRFVAGQDNASGRLNQPRASIVLARPETGRWHQIRRHLNGLSHPIVGDSSHGSSKLNREWRNERGMLPERTCLHLGRLQLAPNPICPQGIDVTCPLAPDMLHLLREHLFEVMQQAEPILREEGISLSHP